MTVDEISQYILSAFEGVTFDTSTPDSFFFVDPERKFPFATIVTNDSDYDSYSELSRPSVFRLNINAGKARFEELIGPLRPKSEGEVDDRFDYAALDRILPNPIYGRMFWISVLNPGATTLETVKSLLAAAYEADVRKYASQI